MNEKTMAHKSLLYLAHGEPPNSEGPKKWGSASNGEDLEKKIFTNKISGLFISTTGSLGCD
jgi:hypothetical protein